MFATFMIFKEKRITFTRDFPFLTKLGRKGNAWSFFFVYFVSGSFFSTTWFHGAKVGTSRPHLVAARYLRKVNGPWVLHGKLLRVLVARALFVDDNPDRFKSPDADRAREETRGGYAVSLVSGLSHGQNYAHRRFADPRSRSNKYDAMPRINRCGLQPLSDDARDVPPVGGKPGRFAVRRALV